MSPFASILKMVLFLSAGVALGQTPSVEIQPAHHFRFFSEAGQPYQIEGAADEASWQPLGEIVWGTGAMMDVLLPSTAASSMMKEFRAVKGDVDVMGPAVSWLAGSTCSLNESGDSANYHFYSDTSGAAHFPDGQVRSFTCTLLRTSASQLKVSVHFHGYDEVLELNFTLMSAGGYVRHRPSVGNIPADDDTGVFTLSNGIVWETSGGLPMTESLEGSSMAVLDGDAINQYIFNETGGTLLRSGEAAASFTYSFDVGLDGLGHAVLDLGSGITQELELTQQSPSTGQAKLTVKQNGAVQSTTDTTFSKPAESPPPPLSSIPCPAPDDLDDIPLDLSDIISGLATYTFGPGSGGQKVTRDGGSIEFTPFSYGYRRLDDLHAKLVISFPSLSGDEMEVIDLTYSGEDDCAGTFKKQSYRNGSPVGPPVNGSFGPGSSPPTGTRLRFFF